MNLSEIWEKTASRIPLCITFVVGGFLGLEERILRKVHFLFSLSQMIFSHELVRLFLLEQIYYALAIMKGSHYAK